MWSSISIIVNLETQNQVVQKWIVFIGRMYVHPLKVVNSKGLKWNGTKKDNGLFARDLSSWNMSCSHRIWFSFYPDSKVVLWQEGKVLDILYERGERAGAHRGCSVNLWRQGYSSSPSGRPWSTSFPWFVPCPKWSVKSTSVARAEKIQLKRSMKSFHLIEDFQKPRRSHLRQICLSIVSRK